MGHNVVPSISKGLSLQELEEGSRKHCPISNTTFVQGLSRTSLPTTEWLYIFLSSCGLEEERSAPADQAIVTLKSGRLLRTSPAGVLAVGTSRWSRGSLPAWQGHRRSNCIRGLQSGRREKEKKRRRPPTPASRFLYRLIWASRTRPDSSSPRPSGADPGAAGPRSPHHRRPLHLVGVPEQHLRFRASWSQIGPETRLRINEPRAGNGTLILCTP
ncbi:hypothetical protein ABZ446_46295 [Streptomyces sp. NPDC005813]|uniref:hypothetical protein n=1 Tax=Streptomyces sp. NPDC005813 TaxID=3155592 RepID=UPI0033DCAE60